MTKPKVVSEDKTGAVTLVDRGIYYMSDDFTQASTKEVINWILNANVQPNTFYDHLTLIITSWGGDLTAAFALVDMMNGSKIPVHTVGLGVIASAGLLTFITGKNRIITPNTSILSHQYTWGSYGKEHELIATAKEFDFTTKRIINHYKKHTKLTEKVIREKLLPPQDVWLDAKEALKFNLADEIKTV